MLDIRDGYPFQLAEVSFKNGSHKGFYKLEDLPDVLVGDDVVVDTGNGSDVGRVSLMGELVRLQLKKKKVRENTLFTPILRKANERDLERLEEARQLDKPTLIRARAIARSLNLDMKIGDVEFQGDKRKATFFYTADGRVDFRELIRVFAREFRVKIEMRQIGARQESSRTGGIGSCGRELCCSTWLSDFKSVSTAAARYQNLAINQAKLSGQCGRLKCCLNYELDAYMEAIDAFPDRAERLETQKGRAILLKTDVFKGLLFYAYEKDHGRGKIFPQTIDMVKEIQRASAAGDPLPDFLPMDSPVSGNEGEEVIQDYSDVTGAVELPDEMRRRKKKTGRNREEGNRPPRLDNRPGGPSRSERRPEVGNRPPRLDNRPGGPSRSEGRPEGGNRPPRLGNRPSGPNRPEGGNRPPRPDNRPGGSSRGDARRDIGHRPPRTDFRPDGPPFRKDDRPTRSDDKREENT